MAKVFNVEQLRVGDGLLTGSAQGLFYRGQQLAAGTSAVPNSRVVTAGSGLKYSNSAAFNGVTDTLDLSVDRSIHIYHDPITLEIDSDDRLKVRVVYPINIDGSIAGSGLLKSNATDAIHVVATSAKGLEVLADSIGIKDAGVTNDMLFGGITDSKLATISALNKVAGSAVQLNGDTLENNNGLKLKNLSVSTNHIQAAVAGLGLSGLGGDNPLDVGAGSGIHVQGDHVNIAVSGVKNTMLFGEISNDKLLLITATDKVSATAVQIAVGGGLEKHANGLQIADNAIGRDELNTAAIAGSGLVSDVDDYLHVGAGSGIVVHADSVNIKATGIVNSMISDAVSNNSLLGIHADKLQGGISVSQTLLFAGAGLKLNVNQLDVIGGDGIIVLADEVKVSSDVVRTLATVTQTLLGNYTFDKAVNFTSDVIIGGNLQVQSETLRVQGTEVDIGDNIIVLNADYLDGTAAPDAGIEIQRGKSPLNGTLAENPRASIVFDDDGTDVWRVGAKGGEGEILTSPRKLMDPAGFLTDLRVGTFSMSHRLPIGSNRVAVPFMHGGATVKLNTIPNVIVSLQNTGTAFNGGGFDSNTFAYADMLGYIVTTVSQTGFFIDFTNEIPGNGDDGSDSEYYVKAFVSTV